MPRYNHKVPEITRWSGARGSFGSATGFLPTYSHYRAWPVPLPSIEEVDAALDRLNAVLATPRPETPPKIDVSNFLDDPGQAVAGSLNATITAERFEKARQEAADTAGKELKALAVAHFDTMHETMSNSWAEWVPLFATVDTSAPDRLTGADSLELSADARETIILATTLDKVATAAQRYAAIRARYQNNEDAEDDLLRTIRFPSFETYNAWRDGLDLHRHPINGQNRFAWAMEAGGQPTIVRSHVEHAERIAEVWEWTKQRAGGRSFGWR